MENKQATNRSGKLVCNVSSTKYEIVRHVTKKVFGWKLSYEEESEEWDLFWTDSAVQPEKLAKMRHYQRINHFPGMYLISRKNYLAYNLGKLRKLFPNDYNFFPKTWVIPCDLSDLKSFMLSKKNPYVIVKPEASCQGRGIYLTKKIEDINPDEKHVVQEYISKPFLIDGLKFDLRIYVLVTSCDPLRIFIHEDGLTRFATEDYEKPNLSNIEDLCMHLTNYAINKNNPNFIYNEDPECDDVGHKRSLKSTYDYLADLGKNAEKLKSRIDDMIIKTLCTIQPNLCHHYRSCQSEDYSRSMCFEILGFDVILDRSLNPYILEVNHTPSFTTDSPLDRVIKKRVISEAIKLINISLPNRKKYFKKQKEDIQKRSLTGKLERLTKEEKEALIDLIGKKKNKYESKYAGKFRKIYPIEGSEKYTGFIEAADNIWREWTGAKIVRNKRVENKRILEKRVGGKNAIVRKQAEELTMERPNSTIFERLSQPIIRKYRSTTAGYMPGVVYDEKKDGKKEEKRDYPVIIYGESEKLQPKPRTLSELKHTSPSQPSTQRQIIETLKHLLTTHKNTVAKNKYLEYLLSNR